MAARLALQQPWIEARRGEVLVADLATKAGDFPSLLRTFFPEAKKEWKGVTLAGGEKKTNSCKPLMQ